MYLSYTMVMIMLSLLELAALAANETWQKKATFAALITASVTAFFLMSNRLGATHPIGFYGVGQIPWAKCSMAKCDIFMNSAANTFNTKIIDTLNQIAPKNATVTVIPWGYDYQFSNGRKNDSIMPDARIPDYKGETTQAVFASLIMQQTPFIVINKAFTSPSNVKQDLVNIIIKNSNKVYENEIFIVFRPEFIPLSRWPLGNPIKKVYSAGFDNLYGSKTIDGSILKIQ
jgi:hypothetical protein